MIFRPLTTPLCGYSGTDCPLSFWEQYLIHIAVGGSLALLLLITLLCLATSLVRSEKYCHFRTVSHRWCAHLNGVNEILHWNTTLVAWENGRDSLNVGYWFQCHGLVHSGDCRDIGTWAGESLSFDNHITESSNQSESETRRACTCYSGSLTGYSLLILPL